MDVLDRDVLDTAAALLATCPRRSALILDFDGVLSPIVIDPRSSRLPEAVRPALDALGRSLSVLAVVSGRPASFLLDRVAVPGAVLRGSYGLETVVDGAVVLHPAVAPCTEAIAVALASLRAQFAHVEGLYVEEKSVSVAVHYRNATDPGAARAVETAMGALAARIHDDLAVTLEPIGGKRVWELKPQVAYDKSDAVDDLLAGSGATAVVYVGDDEGDVPALNAARRHGGYGLVVQQQGETHPTVAEAASGFFADNDHLYRWLAALAGDVAVA